MNKDSLLHIVLRWILGRVTKSGVLSLHIKKSHKPPKSARADSAPWKGLSKFTFNGKIPFNETWFSFKFHANAYCDCFNYSCSFVQDSLSKQQGRAACLFYDRRDPILSHVIFPSALRWHCLTTAFVLIRLGWTKCGAFKGSIARHF